MPLQELGVGKVRKPKAVGSVALAARRRATPEGGVAMKCRLCGRGANDAPGYLARVNELGVPGVWECRPACGVPTAEHPILAALADSVAPPPHQE